MLHIFIINSSAGHTDFSDMIRSKLESKKNFDYLVFNSQYEGHEKVLAAQLCDLFPDEKIRFYCCGGSGTFRNVLSGIPDISRVEIAEVAYGNTNDFLVVFGKEKYKFANLDALIDGDVLSLDYMNSNLGASHNTISFGYDTKIIKLAKKMSFFSLFSGKYMYLVAGFFALFTKSNVNTKVVVDGKEYDGNFEQITIANGRVLGGTLHVGSESMPNDGKLDVLIFPKMNFFTKILTFIALSKMDSKRVRKKSILIKASRVDVYMKGGEDFEGNFDGEYITGDHLTVNIVRSKMNFVVPKGVRVKEPVNDEI